MKCVITGGTGFVGRMLARRVLEIGELRTPSGVSKQVSQLILTDVTDLPEHDSLLQDDRLVTVPDDIRTLQQLEGFFDANGLTAGNSQDEDVSVFHLSSIMSGQGEEDFDLCMGVNVDGIRNLVDVFRKRGIVPKFVSASSIACMPAWEEAGDRDKLGGATTYGMTKAFTELFVNDCSRKGFIDGRTARLPTIVPRPGAPNKAATGAFSSIIREPLHGRPFECPLAPDRRQPVSGYRELVEELLALHEVSAADLEASADAVPGGAVAHDRAVQLHGTPASLDELHTAMLDAAKERGIEPANVEFNLVPELDQFVAEMAPVTVSCARAEALGLPANPPLKEIVKHYIDDFLGDDFVPAR